jgi:metal-responsive CopG/Arc/MetJ family transcriptional regulator
MERMVKQGKVTKTDPYAEKLEVIYKALQDYLLNKKKAPQINKGELSGVHKLVGNHVASTLKSLLKWEKL